MGHRTASLGAVLLLALVVALAGAPGSPLRAGHGTAAGPQKRVSTAESRMDSAVTDAAAGESTRSQRVAEGLQPGSGRVLVEITGGPAASRAVRDAGGEVEDIGGGSIEARVPLATLSELAASSAVERVAAPDPGVPEAVTGQEVAGTGAAPAQLAGINGAGVKVMVLDGGFDGWDASQAGGELPAGLITLNLCSSFTAGGSHGTQVAQLLHEMAPGAQLFLACATSLADLAQAVAYAKANDVRIINRSIGIFNTGRGDGTGGVGTPDSIVNDAVAAGILWVNSAGNYARSHWGGPWADADADGMLEWDADSEANEFTVGAGDSQCVYLKWDSWPATNVDLDLFVTDRQGNVTAADGPQTGSQPPTERACVPSTSSSQTYDVQVRRFGSGTPGAEAVPRLDLFIPETNHISHPVAATSLNDLAGSPSVLSTGAVCAPMNTIQTYSSQGPSIGGLVKPDLTALTPVSNSFEAASGCFSGFGGSSATAPQAAGAAALYAQALGLKGDALRSAMERVALGHDLGVTGKDNVYGAGLVTVDLVCSGKPVTILGSPADEKIRGSKGSDVISGLAGNDRLAGAKGADRICGGPGKDRLSGGRGKDRLLGGDGKDKLKGGPGKDKLIGGPGKDKTKQ